MRFVFVAFFFLPFLSVWSIFQKSHYRKCGRELLFQWRGLFHGGNSAVRAIFCGEILYSAVEKLYSAVTVFLIPPFFYNWICGGLKKRRV